MKTKEKTKKIKSAAPALPIREYKEGQIPVRRSAYMLAAFISLATLVIFGKTLQNDFVNWDDYLYIIDNLNIRSLNWKFFQWAATTAMTPYYWQPLTWISHAVDYALWGLDPLGHHLTSIVFHALNSGMVVWLTIRLLEIVNEDARAAGKPAVFEQRGLLIAAGITGMLFGVHPLHVESVAWISERKDLLYTLLYMLAMLSYLGYALDLKRTEAQKAFYLNKRYYGTLALFFLSLAGKPMAVTLPVILFLLDWYPLKRIVSRKNIPALIVEKIPFFALSGVISLSTLLAHDNAGGFISLEESPLATRTLVVFRGLMMYLWKMIAPFDLLPIYPYPRSVSVTDPVYLAAILLVSVITIACLRIAKKQPYWLAVWAFFIITPLPVLGFFHTGREFMADRFVYLAALGPFLLAGSGAVAIWTKISSLTNRGTLRKFAAGVAIAVFISLSYLTLKQIAIWKTDNELWSYLIEKGPDYFPFAYKSRGLYFQTIKQYDRALEDYNAAISQDPEYIAAYVNRGVVLCEKGQYERAIDDFNKAIDRKKADYFAYNNRGNAYYRKGDRDRALQDFNSAIKLHPSGHEAFNNRGSIFYKRGETGRALEDFTKAISLSPSYADAYYNRSALFMARGKYDLAVQDITKVIEYYPGMIQAYVDRGDLYRTSGLIDRAIKDYQKACDLGSNAGCSKALFPFQ